MEFLTANKLRFTENTAFAWRKPADSVRRRALARLYERRSAVENLISALERYQQEQRRLKANARPALPLRRCRRKIALDRELDQPHQIVNVQFAHQACPVGIHRLGADLQQIGDIFGA